MSRVTAIICGVLLFGLGLFFGMIGSFLRTLPAEPLRTPKVEARATTPTPPPAKRAGQTQPAPVKHPPPAVESALSQALAMVAVALAEQPATPVPPAPAVTPPVAPADTVTNASEQQALNLLVPGVTQETAPPEPPVVVPPAPEPPPLPEPAAVAPPNPLAGHWVFDRQLGWLWLPENTTSVVIVPVIEVFPGGLITIHAGPKTGASRTPRRNAAPPSSLSRDSVIRHDAPGVMRKPATSPFPNKN